MAFNLNGFLDMQSTARQLPEGVVACAPSLIAGPEHIEGILVQAKESWKRDLILARNRSIDLLMRITCQRQIADAISLSGLSKTDKIAVFGLVTEESAIKKTKAIIRKAAERLERNDNLLFLDNTRLEYLKTLHSLPHWFNKDQVLIALKEKSALLVFAK